MSQVISEIVAQSRSLVGKGASRRLRRNHSLVPSIVYGAGKPATNLSIQHHHLLNATQHEVFFSSILTLNVDGKKEKVILKALQRHPAREIILHADFLRINENEDIIMHIPIHFIGEEDSPGVKAGGLVNHAMNDVEIKCLPAHLPEAINVDVSHVEIGMQLHISDIKLPAHVKFAHPVEDEAHNHLVYGISEPKAEVEIDSAAPVAPQTEVINEKPLEDTKE